MLIVEPPGTGKFNVPRWLFFTAKASAFRRPSLASGPWSALSGGTHHQQHKSDPQNPAFCSSYLKSMSVENLERFPAAAPVKSEQSGPGTILSGVTISVTRMNSIDAAEHLPAPGTASKGASKNASRLVQASTSIVWNLYTGVIREFLR